MSDMSAGNCPGQSHRLCSLTLMRTCLTGLSMLFRTSCCKGCCRGPCPSPRLWLERIVEIADLLWESIASAGHGQSLYSIQHYPDEILHP